MRAREKEKEGVIRLRVCMRRHQIERDASACMRRHQASALASSP